MEPDLVADLVFCGENLDFVRRKPKTTNTADKQLPASTKRISNPDGTIMQLLKRRKTDLDEATTIPDVQIIEEVSSSASSSSDSTSGSSDSTSVVIQFGAASSRNVFSAAASSRSVVSAAASSRSGLEQDSDGAEQVPILGEAIYNPVDAQGKTNFGVGPDDVLKLKYIDKEPPHGFTRYSSARC